MRQQTITFAKLRDLLLELGFQEVPPTPTRKRFVNNDSRVMVFVHHYGATEAVSERDLRLVRHQLVGNRLMEESAIDRFLHPGPV